MDDDPEAPERATRQRYPAKYKLEILTEYDGLDRDGKGPLLRREALYTRVGHHHDSRTERARQNATARPPLGHAERRVARAGSQQRRLRRAF